MSNTSATGGYLGPASSSVPVEDDALEDFLQGVVAAITGIDGTLVRPRYQDNPPTLPGPDITWAATGVMPDRRRDTFAVVDHDSTGDGADDLIRHEEIDLLCSFYGPGAGGAATELADGLQIAQNREVLIAAGMDFVGSDGPRRVPEQIKGRWLQRQDLTVTIRREVRRQYPILNLLSVTGDLSTGTTDHPINA